MKKKRYIPKFLMGGRSGGGGYEIPAITEKKLRRSYTGGADAYINPYIPTKPQVDRGAITDKVVDEKVFKDLAGKTHTNEYNDLIKAKTQFESELMSLDDMDIITNSTKFRSTMDKANELNDKSNELLNSFNRTKEAFEVGKSKQNLGNFNYVSGEGVLVKVNETGQILRLPIAQATKELRNNNVKWLTNDQAWQERDVNPQLSKNAALSASLSYGYGQFKLNDEIRKAWTSLGKTSGGSQVKKGWEIINSQEANSKFFNEVATGSKHSNNHKQARAALDAALASLDKEAKDVLMSQAAYRLANSGKEINDQNLNAELMQFFVSTMQSKLDTHFESSYSETPGREIEDPNKGGSGSGSGGHRPDKIGPYESALVGTSTQKKIEFADGNLSVNSLGHKIPTLSESKKGTKDNVSNSKLSEIALIDNVQLNANGKTVDPRKVLVDKDSGWFTYAIRTPDGRFLTGDNHPEIQNLKSQVETVVKSAEKEQGRKLTDDEYNSIADSVQASNPSFRNVQRVAVFSGTMLKDDAIMEGMSDNDYVDISDELTEVLANSLRENDPESVGAVDPNDPGLLNAYGLFEGGYDRFMRTTFVVPARNRTDVRHADKEVIRLHDANQSLMGYVANDEVGNVQTIGQNNTRISGNLSLDTL